MRPVKPEIIFLKLLMLSSSRCKSEDYLQHAKEMIATHLGDIQELLFIPFAGVTIDWDSYTAKVQSALSQYHVTGIHHLDEPVQGIQQAKAIIVGGGNTFKLLDELYRQNLLAAIQQKVHSGTPYIGWSAGSNICGNSIRTTNDMPIIQPPSFDALNFVPFQLNPHYSDYQPPGHNGETRAQRIAEFCTLNPSMPVIGIREGTALIRQGQGLHLAGALPGVVFCDKQQDEIQPGEDLSKYLAVKPQR
jgi:dipeptidase E